MAGTDGSLPNAKAKSERVDILQKDDTRTIISYPAVADETIFTTLKDGYAVAEGRDSWITELESEGTGTPSIACGAVYCTDDAYTYALDRASGERIWKSDAASLTAPAVSDGLVVVGGFGRVATFDGESGEQLWEATYPHGGTTYGIASTADFVVATTKSEGTGHVHCYTTNGVLQWSQEVGAIFSMPAISEGKVFVGGQDGKLHAVRIATGEEVWQTTVGPEIETGFAVSDATVFVPGGANGKVYALDSKNGEIRWTQSVGISPSGPALVGDELAVIGDDVRALDAEPSQNTGIAILDTQTGNVKRAYDVNGASSSLVDASGSLAVGQESLYYLFQGVIYKIA